MKTRIGILAIQGDFAKHREHVERTGFDTRIVRWSKDLDDCRGLILPGGESTTFIKIIKKNDLFESLRKFAQEHPVMGTCAGLITLAAKLSNNNMETLGLIDIEAERNAYGRQVDSFIDNIRITSFKDNQDFEGVFIRAPKIHSAGQGTEVLGYHKDDIVMVRNEKILAMTFHPELTDDLRIHQYFINEMVLKTG